MENAKINITLSDDAKKIIEIIESNNYEAWIVGGYIRNFIIENIESEDIDIATNALPEKIKQMFENTNYTIYNLGEKFGTVCLIPKDKKQTYEITTYRTENNYSDSRHPDSVTFTNTIEKDLSRRDFTANAIAYNIHNEIFDPYNGIEDIQNKVIRCVGNASERFSEDNLRILRALRFASTLQFNIENKTEEAIIEMKASINNVSAERIRVETTKLLCSNGAKQILDKYRDVIFEIIPELKALDNYDQHTKYHSYDAYTHTLITLDKMPPTEIGRWAALLHDIGKPDCFTMDENGQGHFYGHPKKSFEISKRILKRLKFSNKKINSILLLIRWHDQPMAATKKSVKKILRKFSEEKCEFEDSEMFKMYCDIRRADSYAHAENYREYLTFTDEIQKVFEEIIAEDEAFSLKDLAINGADVIALGYEPGPKISEALNKCLEAVINEEVQNEKAELLNLIR